MAEHELRTQLGQLQQHVQQLQEQAQTASALEYRCEGLVKDVQHRDQQIGHLKGEVKMCPPPQKTLSFWCGAGIVAQLQSSLHKERERAQSLEESHARLSSEQQGLASSRDSALLAHRVRWDVIRGACISYRS